MIEPTGQVSSLSTENADQPIRHGVAITTLPRFFRSYLNWSPNVDLRAADWLTFASHHLATIAYGAVYHDDLGLQAIRDQLAFYPRDVWLYMLAAGWRRISQEEHMMPRAGYVGDELGSTIMGSKLVRDSMRLCFLMERQYAPYPKWFGSAFKRLACADEFAPVLQQAQQAKTWQDREQHLNVAYEALARKHNALHITDPLHTTVSPFFGRPFQVIWGDLFANAIRAEVSDPTIRILASYKLIGSVDQWIDSTDALDPQHRLILTHLYLGG